MRGSTRSLQAALPPGEQVQSTHCLELDPSPRLVATARAFVLQHVPELPQDTLDVLLLLTSELVTNAVIHARTQIEVGVTLSARSLLVTVHDLDLHRPSQQPYAEREGGWGLALVTALAEAHAIDPHPDGGKTAWFRLARGDAPAVADSAAARSTPPRERPLEAEA